MWRGGLLKPIAWMVAYFHDITQIGQEPTFLWTRWQESVEYARYEPSLFVGTHSISKEQQLALSFDGRGS